MIENNQAKKGQRDPITKWKKAIWEDTLFHKTQNHEDSI
jgi:hypothetical protein